MSYSNPDRRKYAVAFDAGNNGDESWSFRGPKGKKGRIIDYGVEGVTEAFTAAAQISVGTESDADAYGEEIAVGALAVDSVLSLQTLYDKATETAAYDALLVNPILPADTDFMLKVVDDSAAGIGTFFVIVDWDD